MLKYQVTVLEHRNHQVVIEASHEADAMKLALEYAEDRLRSSQTVFMEATDAVAIAPPRPTFDYGEGAALHKKLLAAAPVPTPEEAEALALIGKATGTASAAVRRKKKRRA